MILAIVFAQVWGVIQLIVLGTLARTVRVRTVLAAMAVGLYAIGPLTVILQLSWIRVAAALIGKSVSDMTGLAAYTVDPFIEEALKLLPLVLLMLIPAIRRQWSLTDCVLIAAAVGSGYGLAEHLYRFASSPNVAEGVSGGWAMAIGRYTPMVPGIFNSLTSWLPPGIWFDEEPTRVNWHLAWSAIGGLAVGLALRYPKRSARLTAAGLFLLIALDHASGNTHDLGNTWMFFLAWPLNFITSHLGFFAFAALVAALWLDRAAQQIGEAREPLLAAERSASTPLVGLLTAAMTKLPWSLWWVLGYDRARRAYYAAHASAPESVNGMYEALVADRDRVDLKLTQPAPPIIPASLRPDALRALLRSRPVIISLVLLAPSILYLIIGGYPQTLWVQAFVKMKLVWPLVVLITLSAQTRLLLRVVRSTRRMASSFHLPVGDNAAMLGLQLACGVGSLVLGGFTLMRVFGGVHPGETLLSHDAHGADAAKRVTPADGSSVSNSGGEFGPSASGSGGGNSSQSSNSSDSPNSSSDNQQSQEPPAPSSNDGSPSDYSPLPPPAPPPPGDPSDFQPAAQGPSADSASDYSPLPPPAPPPPGDPSDFQPAGRDPFAAEPSDYSPLPPPSPPPPSADGPGITPDNEDGVGTRAPDPSDGYDDDPVNSAEHSDSHVGSDAPDGGADHHMEQPSSVDRGPAGTPDEPDASTAHPDLERSDSHPEPGSDSSDAPSTNVHDLPNAPPEPSTNVHDLPDAPSEPSTNVHDLPDAHPDGPTIEPVKSASDTPAAAPGNEDGVGTRAPDDEDGYGIRHPDSSPAPSHPQPTAQDQADRAASDAADAAAKADANADAARQRLVDAHNAEDSDSIHRATTDHATDPDVAAAQQRTHDAQAKSEAADNKSMLDGDDPWDTNAKAASKAAHDQAQAAQDAEAAAEQKYADQQQAAADASNAASDQAQSAADAANAKAAAAHDASLQAANNAGHAASVDSAASDYAAAQAKANAAWEGSDADAYSEAQKAALAAKKRLEDAQAAADAARDKPDEVSTWTHKKP